MTRFLEPLVIVHVLLGAYSGVLLGIGLAFSLANFLISYGKVSGRVLRARISRLISVIIFVMSMFFFQLSQGLIRYLAEFITQIMKTPIISSLWFVYPISIARGIYLSFNDPYRGLQLLLIQIAYILAFLVLYMKSFNNYFIKATVPMILVLKYKTLPVSVPKKWTMSYLAAIIIKDFKIMIREPRVASLVFTPLYLTIMFLLPLFSSKMRRNPVFCDISSIAYAIMLIMIVPLVLLQLIISEGKSLWLSLHILGKKRLLKGKIFFTIANCTIYAVVVALIMSMLFNSIIPLILILEAILTSYTISCIIAIRIAPKLTPMLRAMPSFTPAESLKLGLISLLVMGSSIGAYGLMLMFFAKTQALLISLIICILEAGVLHLLVERISEGAI